ncbi:hypothetical protein FOMPIDRAFT_1111424 [Fomitopsis schrenkii]|uniref:CHAT domain-containing protein n=1 Tax=Fomitopsis schrenkii TaxID=2126942 RepID=S8G6B0_FOMSC|nr:hypothetical protein FOMPIDRAFT_1111424 [Fomitopsis schrenkii]
MTELAEPPRQLRATSAQFSPGDQTDQRGALFLAAGLESYDHFRRFGDRADLDLAVMSLKRALFHWPPGHQAHVVNNLAVALHTRFEQLGDRADLDSGIDLLREALELHPAGHPDRSASINDLATYLQTRFELLGDRADLDSAVTLHREALELRPVGHPDRGSSLNNLANALLGDHADLDSVIALHREALEIHPVGHPHRSFSLNNIGSALQSRFEQLGDRADLDSAINLHREALELRPSGHPDRSSSLSILATALRTRFKQLGDRADLDSAITLRREALELRPAGHPDRSMLLNNLARSLNTRFEQLGDRADLDSIISLHCEALEHHPAGHPDRSSSLTDLGSALQSRFRHRGDRADLASAINLHHEALELHPTGHPDRCGSLGNLANDLKIRFEQFGDPADLDNAIALHRESHELHPVGHPHRSVSLNNLASSLNTRFRQLGDRADLDSVISLHCEALELCPAGDPRRSWSLTNLGSALQSRFEQLGDCADLDRAIDLHHEALELRPVGHLGRSWVLSNLAVTLQTRFEQLGGRTDLDRAIDLHRDTLELCPAGHSNHSLSLNNLATALHIRFTHFGDRVDLESATSLHREVLVLHPAGHPIRSLSLRNLANTLQCQFEQLGALVDMDSVITLHREALELCPTGHPHHSLALHSLASALQTRFNQLGDHADLDKAIDLHREAVELLPTGHPNHVASLNNLAISLFHRWHDSKDNAALDEFVGLCETAATVPPGISLLAVARLARFSEIGVFDQPTQKRVVEVYSEVISLMPQVAYLGLSPSRRLQSIIRAEPAAVMAASHALALHDISTAIQLLEQGRAVFWQQATRLRTPLLDSQLPQSKQNEINQLLHSLDNQPSFLNPQDRRSVEQDDTKRWRQTQRLEELLKEAREQFEAEAEEHSLLPPKFPTLIQAARKGPIVLLLSTAVFSGAVIIKQGGASVVHIPEANPSWLVNWVVSWYQWVESARVARAAHLVGQNIPHNQHELLAELWHKVAFPVIQALGFLQVCFWSCYWKDCMAYNIFSGKSERQIMVVSGITLCPTGIFSHIPIHAAGVYPNGPCCSDYFISSYTSTLTALLKSRDSFQQPLPTHTAKVVLAAVPTAANSSAATIHGTTQEINAIKHLLCGAQPSLLQDSSRVVVLHDAQSAALKEQLRDASILHLASHGIQMQGDPLQSGFLMADKMLTMKELMEDMELSLPNAFLAILSACQTATGDVEQADQAVHLAATMQFLGFKSVVATMWNMADSVGTDIAKTLYQHLYRDPSKPLDPDLVAIALDDAVKRLCTSTTGEEVLPSTWAPFIHIGL